MIDPYPKVYTPSRFNVKTGGRYVARFLFTLETAKVCAYKDKFGVSETPYPPPQWTKERKSSTEIQWLWDDYIIRSFGGSTGE